MLKPLIAGALLCAFGTGVVVYLTQNAQAEDTLTLGTMSGWPPFVSINANGAYEGFDIDIANEIAKRLGKKLVIKDMDTAALITTLDQGTVDVIMTGLDITPERVKRITMLPYQGEPMTEMQLVFWKKAPEGIQTFEDLKKLKDAGGGPGIICVEAGSSQEEIISNYDGYEKKSIDPLAAVLELQYGRATAMISEKKLFLTLKQKFPELVAIMLPIPKEQQILGCGIGIQKSNTTLTKKVAEIVDDLKKSGFLSNRENYWFTKERS
jgi:arginine transport system substrate-binding protein